MILIDEHSPIVSDQPGVKFRADWRDETGSFWWEGLHFVKAVRESCVFPNTGCWLWFGDTDKDCSDRPMLRVGSARLNVRLVFFNMVHGADEKGPIKARCKQDCICPFHLYSTSITPKLNSGEWGAGILECLACNAKFPSWSKTYNRHCLRCAESASLVPLHQLKMGWNFHD